MVLHVFTSFLGGVPLCIPYGLYSGTSLGGTTQGILEGYPGRVLSVCNFSLGFWPIGSSDFFGPRSKVVLRSEGYAWVPVSGSLDKLREVGVFTYLIYPLFKCFVNA